jgi:hypothetical protein
LTFYVCNSSEKETRPYGKDGQDICYPCMKADPEKEAEAKVQFELQLHANEAASPVGAAIILDDGLAPFDPSKLPPGSIYKEIKSQEDM